MWSQDKLYLNLSDWSPACNICDHLITGMCSRLRVVLAS